MSKLPISTLKLAVDENTNSIKDCSGISSPTVPIELSDFTVGASVQLTTDITNVPYNYNVTSNFVFNSEDILFNRVKRNEQKFIATLNPSRLSLVFESGTTKIFKNVYNPGGTNGSSYVDETLLIKFYDDTYNQDSINYNVNLTKVLRLYSPPKPIISLVSTSRPPRPCCGVGVGWTAYSPCCNASITISYNSNPWQGVNSTSLSFYINGSLHSTSTASTGNVTFGGLAGNTTYNIYAINNFNCRSDTLSVRTPSYV